MLFDKIEHTTGLLHKIKFYCVYGEILFLLSHFLVVAQQVFTCLNLTIETLEQGVKYVQS